MNQSNWKGRERQVNDFFGGEGRTPLSGINSGHTHFDIRHDILGVEHKHRKRHAVISLFKKVKELAKKENKIPVVTLSEKGGRGFYVLVHSSDLTAVANQRILAKQRGAK